MGVQGSCRSWMQNVMQPEQGIETDQVAGSTPAPPTSLKLCVRCNQTRQLDNFYVRYLRRNGNGVVYQSWCIHCVKKRDAERYQEGMKVPTTAAARIAGSKASRVRGKAEVYEYLRQHPCVDCGENDPIVLEFDHIDRSNKLNNVSNMIALSRVRLRAEIAKCEVRCANCHRRKTVKEQDWTHAQRSSH